MCVTKKEGCWKLFSAVLLVAFGAIMLSVIALSAGTASAAAVCDYDNVCEPGENVLWCANDCSPLTIASCGDGFCDPNEQGNCITDCPAGNCTPTNGGNESCDGVDNDCDGLIDDGLDLICNWLPTSQNLTIPSTASQVFTIRIANPNINDLEIKWYDNDASVQNDSTSYSSTYLFLADADMFCSHAIKVVVNDTETEYTAEKEWQLNITGTNNFTLYEDADSDGYGNPGSSIEVCDPVAGYVNNSGDCDDGNASINPGASEIVYNGKDDDCNASTKDDDIDGDSYPIATDCDDGNSAIKPGATEVCDNVDNNCNGLTDSADSSMILAPCEKQTGVCAGSQHISAQCTPAGWQSCTAVNYGANYGDELLDNLDNDCNGIVDDISCSNETKFLGENFQISNTTNVWQEDVAFDGNKYFVVWDVYINTIVGQFLATDGTKIGPVINISTQDTAAVPVVAYHKGSGRWLVAWLDSRAGLSDTGIYGRLFENDGTPVGDDFLIYDGPYHDQYQWAAAVPSGFFVVYAAGDDIHGRIVNSNGALGPDITISNATNIQAQPSAVYAEEYDKLLVTWYDYRNMETLGTDSDIYGQFLNGSGDLIGDNFVIHNAEDYQTAPRAAYSPANDSFLVIFDDQRFTGKKEITAQKIGIDGSLLGDVIYVNDVDRGWDEDPDIAYNANIDKYLGVWTNVANEYGQIFDSNGTQIGDDLVLATNGTYLISVTEGPGSTFLAVWQDGRTGHTEVWGQIISGQC